MAAFKFNDAGQLAYPTAEELAAADKQPGIIVYLTGVAQDERPFYAYVSVRPSRYRELMVKCDTKQLFVPEDYGDVIVSEFEPSPTPEVIDMMRATYGYDERFLEKLRQQVFAEHAIFLKDREDKRIGDIVAMLKKQQSSGGSDP